MKRNKNIVDWLESRLHARSCGTYRRPRRGDKKIAPPRYLEIQCKLLDSSRYFGQKPFGQKPFGRKPFGQKPFGQKPFGQKPFGRLAVWSTRLQDNS